MIDLAPVALARWVHFVALAGLVGFPLYRWRIGACPRRLDTAALIVALVSALAWMFGVAAEMGDGIGDAIDPHHLADVATQTWFGRVWCGRFAGLVILAGARWTRPDAGRLHLALAALVVASLALQGHGIHAPPAWGDAAGPVAHGFADAAHALAGLGWVGSLGALLGSVRSAMPGAECVAHLRRFSRVGLVLVATVGVSGAINALFILADAGDLAGGGYPAVLGTKIALAVGMIGLAATNRFLLLPRIAAGVRRARTALSILVGVELALGAILLGGTALLGLLHPGH